MDKSKQGITYNNCKNQHTAKVLYIQDYFEKRESLKNTGVEPVEKSQGKTNNNLAYFDEDRQKTLDLFAKVLYTMKKENFQ